MAGKGLKAVEVSKLRPGTYSDGGGLYLVVQESGSRSWILRTVVCGKRCEIGLGGLDTRSLAEARAEAAELRGKARKGEDILGDRRAKKLAGVHESSIPIFEKAAIEVHKNLKPTFKSETHAYNWLQSLKTYVFPVFGHKRVDTIDSNDILECLTPIWNEVSDTARRTLRRIDAIFNWCQAKHYRDIIVNGITVTKVHPCDGIRSVLPKQKRTENHHESLPYSELPDFIQKLRVSQSALAVKLAFEFLILTCSRTNEVLGAKWEEIDLKEEVWTIPAVRMKMDKEHKVPLAARCVEILRLVMEFNDSAIVFPGRYPAHPLSNMAFLMTLRRMGEDLTAHGFRATFKTWAEETTKFDSLVIEASMAHAVKGIERHYLRTTFFAERCKLMDVWARFATKAQTGKVRKISR